jgi:transcriptional regulator with XRE-family HTH domain
VSIVILGQRIKFFREQVGYTQQQLAEKAGISSKAVGRYEHGNRVPSVEIAQRIAEAMGISVNELLYPEAIRETPGALRTVRIPDVLSIDIEELQAELDARSDKLNSIIKNFDKLNDAGQQAVIDYVDALTKMQKYKKDKNDKSKMIMKRKKGIIGSLIDNYMSKDGDE